MDIAVEGGTLRVLTWGSGERVVVALHGITGSGMSWQCAGNRMPDGWTLVAPDLRGRGCSADLPPPFGINQHIDDITAVLDHYGEAEARPVLAGHSMGAFIALLTRDAHPELASRTVLIDGGLPLPFPAGADPDQVLDATLGPAIERLGRVYPDEAAYLDFWRAHPALAGHWTADVEDYVRYDIQPAEGGVRSRARPDAVRADGRDLLLGAERFGDALERLPDPTALLTAPMGMFGAPPGLQPPELVAAWSDRAPRLRPSLVADTNHYTIMFGPRGAEAVVSALTSPLL